MKQNFLSGKFGTTSLELQCAPQITWRALVVYFPQYQKTSKLNAFYL